MVDDAARRRLIARALAGRLGEIGGEPAGEPLPPPDDPEETLRLVMVRLWPRARRSDDPAAAAELLAAVTALEGPAAGPDLRFLDAFNVVYESLRAGELRPPERDRFLAAYRRALAAHADA